MQLSLFDFKKNTVTQFRVKNTVSTSGTFADNLKLPIHRWFRYSAGFSSEWVVQEIRKRKPSGAILDPFAGSGTTLLSAEHEHILSFGFESHPFVSRIAKAKLLWASSSYDLLQSAREIQRNAEHLNVDIDDEPTLLHKCYTGNFLKKLCALREALHQIEGNLQPDTRELLWLTITSILRKCSHAGTAQWQYVLPRKTKANVVDPFTAFTEKVNEVIEDMEYFKKIGASNNAVLICHDAREYYEALNNEVEMVITSPPYPNNYDYGDATRLEMCFWHEITNWGDLQKSVRKYLIRSCSQHAAAERLDLEKLLHLQSLDPICDELSVICHSLEAERLNHGGKKAYHLMIAAYFADMAASFLALRKMCKQHSTMCFVIGDSAPYGIYVPVDIFLGKLALNAGFTRFRFEKIRDRNIKWKNRKHRVPLKEGRLLIEG